MRITRLVPCVSVLETASAIAHGQPFDNNVSFEAETAFNTGLNQEVVNLAYVAL